MFVPILDQEITYIKGVGPTKSELLKKELGIHSIRDLLLDYPMRYEDRTQFSQISQIQSANEVVQVKGYITSLGMVGAGRKKRLVGHFTDQTGSLELVWFRSVKWMKENLKLRHPYIIHGRVTKFGRRLSLAHPEIEEIDGRELV